MVFARAKLVLEDNCFEEEPGRIDIKLVGPNVIKLYGRMYDLMKSVFHVTDSDIQETAYNWGKGDKGEKFSVEWWLHKDMDLFTYLFIQFKLKGQGDEKAGNASITVRGLMRSEYPQDTIWQRSLFYEMLRTFWYRVFYFRKREEYAEECRHATVIFQKRLTEYFRQLREGKHEE
jgi:hypothetical protein